MTIKVWSWRQAIIKSGLESTTKLVLLVLASYMNEHGGGCYPSVATISADTSLGERAVLIHLKKAISAGFIIKRKRGVKGQEWASNEYAAALPADYEIREAKPAKFRDEYNAPLDEVRAAPDAAEGCTTMQSGVHDVRTISPENTTMNLNSGSKNLLHEASYSEFFEKFWQAFLRKEGREAAYLEFCKVLDLRDIPADELINRAARYSHKMRSSGKPDYCLLPVNWLQQKRWTDELPELPKIAAPLEKETSLALNDANMVAMAISFDSQRDHRLYKYLCLHGVNDLASQLDKKPDMFGKTKEDKLRKWFADKQKQQQNKENV